MTSPTADGLMSRMRRKSLARRSVIPIPGPAAVAGGAPAPARFAAQPGPPVAAGWTRVAGGAVRVESGFSRRPLARAEQRGQPLHPRREAVPQQLAPADRAAGHPVELDDPA